MTRRHWLSIAIGCAGAGCAPRQGPRAGAAGVTARRIESATGPLRAEQLGVTLMHEHVLVDFIGAELASPSRYSPDEAFAVILPHLRRLRAAGCDTLVECTPAHLGRDARLLRRLSEASGLQILSNTGYYGAANDKHLPRHAFSESADQLAARWIREFERGLDGTAVKPAFMKIGVDSAPLSEVDAKLVAAAAITRRQTGLPIASHTTTGAAALEQLDILDRHGVPALGFIWVHAHNERDTTFHTRAARRGAWVELDGISETSVARHVQLTQHLKAEGLLAHLLVSQDAGWYRVGEPGGGQFRGYDSLFSSFVPALAAAGFSDRDVRQLLVTNPRRALSGEAAAAVSLSGGRADCILPGPSGGLDS